MRLAVETLLAAPEPDTVVEFQEKVEFPPDLGRLTRPLAGQVTVLRSLDDSGLRLTGHLEAEVELVCDRCLGPARTPVAFDLDEMLTLSCGESTAQEVEETVSPTGELDLSDLLRQHLILNLPSRHLCGCEPAYLAEYRPVDPRWRQLEQLLERTPEEESNPHGST